MYRGEEVMYECDPAKNTACKKTMCMHNPDSESPYCGVTLHIEYAANRRPFRMIMKRGAKMEFEREYLDDYK